MGCPRSVGGHPAGLRLLLPAAAALLAAVSLCVGAEEGLQFVLCTDYRPGQQPPACLGRPRQMDAELPLECYAYSPDRGSACGAPAGYACNPQHQYRTAPWAAAYSGEAPYAVYEQGQEVCVQWLRQGPAGDTGATATILACPAQETQDVSQSDLWGCRGGKCLAALPLGGGCTTAANSSQAAGQTSIDVDPSSGQTLCSGCFPLPGDLTVGLHTFQWLATPDSSNAFTTCWDALVVPPGGSGAGNKALAGGAASAACPSPMGQGWKAAEIKGVGGAASAQCPPGLHGQRCQLVAGSPSDPSHSPAAAAAPANTATQQQGQQASAAGQCVLQAGMELAGSELRQDQASTVTDCCAKCTANCNVWVWCPTGGAGGEQAADGSHPTTNGGTCTLAGGRQLPPGGCLLRRSAEVEDRSQPAAVLAFGAGVAVTSGSPLPQAVLNAPDVPGYATLRGREVKDLYSYGCQGSLAAGECKRAGQPAELAGQCSGDPQCRGFTFFPEGSGADHGPVGFFKGGGAASVDPGQGNDNPRAVLYVRQ